MHILDENSLLEISSLPNVQVHVVNESSSYTLTCVHSANVDVERSNHESNGRLQEGKNNEKFLKRLIKRTFDQFTLAHQYSLILNFIAEGHL